MKPVIYLITAILFHAVPLNAQQKTIDSLRQILSHEASGKEKGRIEIKIAREYISFDTAAANTHLLTGFTIADNANDDMGRGMYHLYSAYLLCNKGQYEEGLTKFAMASDFFNRFRLDKNLSVVEKGEIESLLLDADLSRGNVYLELYEYDKAIDVFWKVLKLLEQSDFPEKDVAIAATYQSIALAYYHWNQYQTALQYYLSALSFAIKSGNERVVAENNIYAAMCYTLTQEFDSASLLLQKAEPVVLQSQDAGLKTMFFARKAEMYRFTDRWQEALTNYDKAIQNATVTANIYMQATFLNAKARCLLKLNKISEAREAGLNSLNLAKSINKIREILEAQKVLSLVESKAGNYAAAYSYLDQFNSGDDSLHTTELTEKIQSLDKKYQLALKEEKIIQLEKDNKIKDLNNHKRLMANFLLSASLIVLFIFGMLVIRNYRQRQKLQQQKIRELETEKQLSAAEAVLKGEEQERTRLAKDLHDGLGGLLSGIKYSFTSMKDNLIMTPENARVFERSLDMLDTSIHEMRRVAHNLMPESIFRFGLDTALADFCSSVNETSVLKINYQSFGLENAKLNPTISVSVYRIIQELVNNALKHAQAQQALVQVTVSDNLLLVDVEDNGVGFDTNMLNIRKGIGWSNIQSRIDYLNGNIDLKSAPGEGTIVHIEINLS